MNKSLENSKNLKIISLKTIPSLKGWLKILNDNQYPIYNIIIHKNYDLSNWLIYHLSASLSMYIYM
jgi:hypothetical protein